MSLQSVSGNSPDIAANLATVRRAIDDAARACGREPGAVHLLAVSKTQPADVVRRAAAAGCTDFGENYLREAVAKIEDLADLDVRWHFIGAIQSNKTRLVARHFHWVHTLAREKIARRLSEQCPDGKTLDVTLQVNIDDDPAKAGVAPEHVAGLLAAVRGLEHLRPRGLMTILQRDSEPLESYRRLADLFDRLAADGGEHWDTLSMGMSGDFAAAIEAGATWVRIGTSIFGPRQARPGDQH
ncbi:MAG: YggS family pyridoxal phosphate-dependent enzyme [Gammaproteobacteria bacterium]|jgi:pyridoxal phosphate enzyme (YggS family)|nr:YggS family pyridoxal phosphate-dependent enzyme [Gammaproteobacteria bacterium]